MSRQVLFVLGSPSPTSKSTLIARALAAELLGAGWRPIFWALGDFDAADILFGRTAAPTVAAFLEAAKASAAIVLATPVYKAAYTGALKAIVDVVPPDAWVGRPALGIATARLPAHGAEVNGAYRALFAFFKARALDTLFVLDEEWQVGQGSTDLPQSLEQRVQKSAQALVVALGVPVADAAHT
jgi:FMN reductase